MSSLDRRTFLTFGSGAVVTASLTLGGCGGGGDGDNFPPVSSSSAGPLAFAKDGGQFQVQGNAHTLVVTSPSGARKNVGGLGSAQGRLNYPVAVAVLNALGYVVETGNHRVQVFDSNGNSLGLMGVGELSYPGGIAAGATEIFVSDTLNGRIVAYSPNGQITRILGAGKLSAPRGLTVVEDGVIVADPGLRKVLKLSFGGTATALGSDWVLPYDAATDGATVYVADVSRNELNVVDATGGDAGTISLAWAPSHVAYRSGRLYVSA